MVTLAPSQRSVAVGALKSKALPHSTEKSGAQVIVGGVVSTTDTVWLHVLVLPQGSAATQVRVAVKVLPEHLATNPDALARFEREAKAAV
jgi:hypothetical protein